MKKILPFLAAALLIAALLLPAVPAQAAPVTNPETTTCALLPPNSPLDCMTDLAKVLVTSMAAIGTGGVYEVVLTPTSIASLGRALGISFTNVDEAATIMTSYYSAERLSESAGAIKIKIDLSQFGTSGCNDTNWPTGGGEAGGGETMTLQFPEPTGFAQNIVLIGAAVIVLLLLGLVLVR